MKRLTCFQEADTQEKIAISKHDVCRIVEIDALTCEVWYQAHDGGEWSEFMIAAVGSFDSIVGAAEFDPHSSLKHFAVFSSQSGARVAISKCNIRRVMPRNVTTCEVCHQAIEDSEVVEKWFTVVGTFEQVVDEVEK